MYTAINYRKSLASILSHLIPSHVQSDCVRESVCVCVCVCVLSVVGCESNS